MDIYARIVKAKMFIDNHYWSRIDLDRLSEEACFSKYHFLRLFKKAYNRTPHKYLSEKRIEKAKEKLKELEHKIETISEEVGFESLTSFCLKFKTYTGETPALFRLRALQTKKQMTENPDRFIPSCFNTMFSPKD